MRAVGRHFCRDDIVGGDERRFQAGPGVDFALVKWLAAWNDALADSLRNTAAAEAIQAIVALELDGLTAIIVPPHSYGRD